jgi:hypothetical protein
MDKYLRILQRMRAGKKISKEEIKFFLGYTSDVDETKLNELKKKEFKDLSTEEIQQMIDESGKLLLTDPDNKAKALELAQDAEKGRISDNITTGLNALLTGADIMTSKAQIAESNRLLGNSKRPSRPALPKADPYLDQAIGQAQLGSLDASRAIAPAQLQILDNYLSDINNAKTAATGNAGQFGALAQVASSRRNRAAQDLIPIADQVKAREQARLDNLIGQRIDQNQQNFANQASLYPIDMQQYQWDQNVAGSLGATGRENLRTSVGNLANLVPNTFSKLAANRKYDSLYNQMSGYGKENAAIAVKAQQDLDRRFSNPGIYDDSPTWEQTY